MFPKSQRLLGLAGFAACILFLTGCPIPLGPDPGTGLVVEPEELNYGTGTNTLTLQVRKSSTDNPMGPLVVSPSVPWLVPQVCTSLEDNCVSLGQGDFISIPVQIRRELMTLGENEGVLTLSAEGASLVRVPVSAIDVLEPAFSVNERRPNVGGVVQFVNESRVDASQGPIQGYLWTFGDGATSSEANPTHAYSAPGIYTITLTATTPTREETITRTAYISVEAVQPIAQFTAVPTSTYVDRPVQFTDQSTAPGVDILEWIWDFGDGSTSRDRNPQHIYTEAGIYTVSLTVRTAFLSDTETKQSYINVQPIIEPDADFTFTPRPPAARQPINFIDQSNPGSAPIESWFWSFGDNTTTTERNPTHTYAESGVYVVKLSVTTIFGVSTETKSIEVAFRQARPDFTVDRRNATVEDVLQFTDQSNAGSQQIVSRLWRFGDGETSTAINPEHQYDNLGTYTVSLTIRTSDGDEFTETKQNYITISLPPALEEYVDTPDPNYSWRHESTTPGTLFIPELGASINYTLHVLRVTSLAWRSPAEITQGRLWEHWVSIIEPQTKVTNTGLLFINGGSRTSGEPTVDNLDDVFVILAAGSGSVISVVQNIPSQPVEFAEEADIRTRTEDALIAKSFDKFMESYDAGDPDPTWAALFPMTKAAVRAMDSVQAAIQVYSTKPVPQRPVTDFVVSGASKRGWTTWLTGAVDDRVKAIMPIVIDVLNMDEQVEHHRNAYGYWSPAIYEYAQEEIFERIETPGGQALLQQVDPFEYRESLTMPKLIINSTGDQFFPPDSSQFYFDEMLGQNYLNYAPNSDHGLEDGTDFFDETSAVNSLQAFYLAILQDEDLPEFTWTFEDNGSIVVQTQDAPLEVTLWQATNPNGRDFRLDRVGPIWTSSPLTSTGGGRYVAQVSEPLQGWRGFFVQLRFANPASLAIPFVPTPDFIFTTPVRVLPDVYPVFEGERFTVGTGAAAVPALKLWGTPQEMGTDYGTLMQTELQDFIPQFLTVSEANNAALTPAALDAAWTTLLPFMDERIVQELQAIADASGVSRVQMQRANMVPVLEPALGAATVVWDEATSSGDVLAGHAVEYPLNRSLQEYRQLTLYIPDDGLPHTTVGFTGLIMSPSGVNLGGISTAAVGDVNPVPPASSSHYLPMFREILYEARSLRGALEIVDNTPLVQDYRFLFGDGRNENRGAKVRVLPPDQDIWFEDDATDEVAPNVAPGLLYTDEDDSIFTALDDQYGVLNDVIMQALIGDEGAADSNLMNVVMKLGLDLDISVSYANGTSPASSQPYATFNMQSELP